jgi:cell division septum initiation protein DivIVA
MSGKVENRKTVPQEVPAESALYRLAELSSEFGAQHIASTARSIAERVSGGRFYVACVGQFKRGKSTLLNALIGEAVLPTGVVPVTTVPSILRYGKTLAARVRFDAAEWTDIPARLLGEYVSERENPENTKGVTGLELFVPSSLLKTGMCLVDTPGLGSVFAGNTAATHAFVPHIDAAIVVIGADPPLSGDELQFVDTVAHQVHHMVFVLNKADRASEAERTAAIEFARDVLGKRLKREAPRVFEISALEHLEGRGTSRDWPELVRALEDLVLHSGHSIVRDAAERGIRRASDQLLAVIREERETLLRPIEDSEQRITRLRDTLIEADGSTRDLGVLLTAEQQRLSEAFAGRRNLFLKSAQVSARRKLNERLCSLAHRHNGPAYRRDANHLAQEIIRTQLTPWLESEASFANDVFRQAACRFVELGNNFLHRLDDIGISDIEVLPEELDSEHGLQSRSQFHFHVIERVAAPASPLLFMSDIVLSALGFFGRIDRDVEEFLDQLLEVNSSRVQSDVDERVRESRRKLETEIKVLVREASAIADRALARARAAQSAGQPAIEAALARLNSIELEIRDLIPLGS